MPYPLQSVGTWSPVSAAAGFPAGIYMMSQDPSSNQYLIDGEGGFYPSIDWLVYGGTLDSARWEVLEGEDWVSIAESDLAESFDFDEGSYEDDNYPGGVYFYSYLVYTGDLLALNGLQFRFVATSDVGNYTSEPFTVYVAEEALNISSDPETQVEGVGDIAAFLADAAGGFAPVVLQWQSRAPGASTFSDIAGETSGSLSTEAIVLADHGTRFRLKASDALATEAFSAEAVLVVEEYSPLDETPVAWFSGRGSEPFTFVAARAVTSYTTASGTTTMQATSHGFLAGDLVVIDTGDAEVDGERTVASVPSSSAFAFANPMGTPTVSPVSVTGTADWKFRKFSAVEDETGSYELTQGTLALMPQLDDVAGEIVAIKARAYRLNMDADLRAALNGTFFMTWASLRWPTAVVANQSVTGTSGGGGLRVMTGTITTWWSLNNSISSASTPDGATGGQKVIFWENDGSNKALLVNSPANFLFSHANYTAAIMTDAHFVFRSFNVYADIWLHDLAFLGGGLAVRDRLFAWGLGQGDVYG